MLVPLSHKSKNDSAVIPLCPSCAQVCELKSKFCSNCGSTVDRQMLQRQQMASDSPPPTVPFFAPVAPRHVRAPNSEMLAEAGKLMILLARERLFLYFHWIWFLFLNFIGVWLAFKCYNEYVGDEFTRIMMGSTPLLYINTCALLCICTIRGTRKEIKRLKEKLSYLKFQIEYDHLV